MFGRVGEHNAEGFEMQEIDVPAGFTVSSYEKDGRFALLFAAAANANPTSDPRAIDSVSGPVPALVERRLTSMATAWQTARARAAMSQ